MAGAARIFSIPNLLSGFVLLLGLFGCSASQPPQATPSPVATPASVATAPAAASPVVAAPVVAAPPQRPISTPPPEVANDSPIKPAPIFPVMLGIDVLEADGFAAVKGKRIGLLTHPAGVNRRSVSTVDVLRRAPNTKLIALFAPEHGLYGLEKASANIPDNIDRRTGLPVYSLHGQNRKPT